MKSTTSSTHSTDLLPHSSHQETSLPQTKNKIHKVLIAIAQTLGQILSDLLIRSSEPMISERRDYDGSRYYQVYDPVYEEIYRFASEDEVRIWLEQRYYRHSAKDNK